MPDNKRIAKNTLFLYVRMMLTMIVALYTSRVVLAVLGIEDYGLYNVVGGVVGMLSFLNGTLSIGTSRFFTYELGRNNHVGLHKTFSTALSIHILFALLIALFAETIGLWFVYNKLSIPPERLSAALFTYHFSILTAVIAMTQVPYNSSIIAHEKMSVYAYFSIVEVLLKLAIVYLLEIGGYDKLKLYALLVFTVQFLIAIFYRFYSVRKFKETRYSFILDKKIFLSILSFSGWNLLANLSLSLNSQGTVIITNIFFGSSVVAAQSITSQANQAIMLFVTNFRTAVNPQIIKTYASGDYEGSKSLTLNTTCYVYYLLLLISLPIILLAEPILHLWLTTVPEYTVVFLQLIIIQNLVDSFGSSFYTPLMASGHIKGNSLSAVYVGISRFAVVYILFSIGFPPTTVLWLGILSYVLYSFIIKPYLLIKNVGYKWIDFSKVFLLCAKVTIVAIPFPIILTCILGTSILLNSLFILLVSVSSVCVASYYIGLSRKVRDKLRGYIFRKFVRN